MNLHAIIRRDWWRFQAELEHTAARSARVGDEVHAGRWIRSYVLKEPAGAVCTMVPRGQQVSEIASRARGPLMTSRSPALVLPRLANASKPQTPTTASDDEHAPTGHLVAPAWLPHPSKSSGAELTLSSMQCGSSRPASSNQLGRRWHGAPTARV